MIIIGIKKRNNGFKTILAVIVMVIGMISFGQADKVLAASQADNIANYALGQVGTKERSAGSDNIIYNDWYYGKRVLNSYSGQYSWCHAFVSYCAYKCGISQSVIPKTANCQQGVNFFKGKGRYYTKASGYTPVTGDIIYLKTNVKSSIAHHVGIVYATDASYVYYVDGNNTTTNPHGVAKSKKTRNDKMILGYGNPAYISTQGPAPAQNPAPVQPQDPVPSINSVKINGIDNTAINFSFSVSNGSLAKVVVKSILTGETITKSYTSGLSNINYSFNRIDMPTGGDKYSLNLYAYSGTAGNYKNEQVHKMTYGKTMYCVTFPDTINNDQAKNITFNYKWYADLNGDLKNLYGYNEDALYKHWITYGIKEGRTASPAYCASFYLKNNRDIAAAYGSKNYAKAYFHYTTIGYKEGRESSPMFSSKYYLSKNIDVANAYGADNLLMSTIHFNTAGLDEFRDSSPYYSGHHYRNVNGDLRNMTSYELMLHYYKYGIGEQRVGNVGKKIPVM